MANSEKDEDSLLSQKKKKKTKSEKPSTQWIVIGKKLMENVPLGA